jgi:polysaccharide export outer membrane protein
MRSLFIIVQLIAFLAVSGCAELLDRPSAASMRPATAPYVEPQEYRLNTGDVVSVRVYGGEEEIRVERIRLSGSGTLVLPFGDFQAQGKTTREIETAVTDSVKGRLLRNPRVSVNIDEYRPFFVDGQVGRPGAYPYQPGLTVRKAITIAGGMRERASLKKIFLVREGDKTSTPLNVDLNVPVGPGDTINVEESFF